MPEILQRFNVTRALEKIDTPGILFFLGILLAVGGLQSFGVLKVLAVSLTNGLQNDYLIATALGLLSSLVDNVPLAAAAQGMFDLSTYPTDHPIWEMMALTTGTDGCAIIIGSAAGIAVMGIQKINFMWYLKKISWLVLRQELVLFCCRNGSADSVFCLLLIAVKNYILYKYFILLQQ